VSQPPAQEFVVSRALIDRAENDPASLGRDDLAALLSLEGPLDTRLLHAAAYRVKARKVGTTVYFRGIVEFSNLCVKNCDYCGIRRDNQEVERFQMTVDEIVAAARWAHQGGYGSVVLQSGERSDPDFVAFVEDTLHAIHHATAAELGVTLSLGEQSPETFRRWHAAGAHRYLLRIETSNPTLYRSLHPEDHDWTERRACLDRLREVGYQVGTGVMIGLPGQTAHDLADDLLFFHDRDVDMIGMGPFIPHADTPLGHLAADFDGQAQLELGLRMIAVARLFLRDVNIASTTALQALAPTGREMGLLAGANIIMPNITDPKYRRAYQLYAGKPCLDENGDQCRDCLERRIESIGETIGYGARGDSPRFRKRR
jgi:biotin synthase